jgi:hypothetical protein
VLAYYSFRDRLARTFDERGFLMAIGLRIKFNGGTQEQYDAIHGHMDVDGNPPEGLIFHAAGPLADGWGVIDFWESREAFDRFAASRLQQATQDLGDRAFSAPPDIKEFPVHHITMNPAGVTA